MEKKQTAVDYFVEQLFKTRNNTTEVKEMDINSIIEQAKQMEKEQIIEAHGIKESHGAEGSRNFWQQTTGEQYYNQTYGGKP